MKKNFMKKNFAVVVVLFCVLLLGNYAYGVEGISINDENFPDDNFRAYVSGMFDDGDGVLTEEEIQTAEMMNIPNMEISSLKGIEYFTALKILDCQSNDLTELDLHSNSDLFLVLCGMNQIKELDLSGKVSLLELRCNNNRIKKLNVRNCSSLLNLHCYSNHFTEIDLTGCKSLRYLDCGENYLSHLALSECPELRELYCSLTPLRSIDVSSNLKLETFDCRANQFTFLDLSRNSELKKLLSEGNSFMNLRITSSDNEAYPFMTDLKNYAGDYFTRIESVMAYDRDSVEIETLFTPTERNAYFSSSPAYISYELGNGYTGTAPESDVPRTVNIMVSLPIYALIVPFVEVKERSSDRWDTRLGFTHGLLDTVCDSFSGIQTSDIYRFNEIISSDTWTLSDEDSEFLTDEGQKFLFSLPLTQAETDGVYVIKCTFGESVRSGDKISMYDMRGTASKVSDFVFIDDSYNVVNNVPENKKLYIAVKLSSGIINTQAVTTTSSKNESVTRSSGGGGCNSFSGIGIILPVMLVSNIINRKKRIYAYFMLIIMFTASASYGDIKPSDYALPIDYRIYDISGTWTTDFDLSRELIDAVIMKWKNGLKPENVHSYSEIALSGTWEVSPEEFYNLAMSGCYGAVVLPLTESGTGNDVYVLMCTFSNDVQPGERVLVSGTKVDTLTREPVYDEEILNAQAEFVMLDENFNPISSVPESRRVYIAVSLLPGGITNSGIISVVRGEYIEESDPLSRLDPNLAKFIADQLGIPVEELNFIKQSDLSEPEEATPEIRQYVKDDRHEIVSGINMLSVDKDGWYIFQVTLSDDVWEQVKNKEIKDFKFYGLSDSEINSGDVQPSFVMGFLNTWELFSLTGEKMEVFSLKTFLFAGLLNAGTPFSVYLAKMLLLLLAGCDSGLTPSLISVLILGMIIIRSRKR